MFACGFRQTWGQSKHHIWWDNINLSSDNTYQVCSHEKSGSKCLQYTLQTCHDTLNHLTQHCLKATAIIYHYVNKITKHFTTTSVPSVLWRCWLGGRKSIWPVKNWVVGCWHGTVICLERDADLHTAQLMPLPLTVSCFSKIQIGFTFLVPAHLGSPGKRCVCVWTISVQKRTF